MARQSKVTSVSTISIDSAAISGEGGRRYVLLLRVVVPTFGPEEETGSRVSVISENKQYRKEHNEQNVVTYK